MSRLPFHCDHIIAEKHGGATDDSNLAWACFRCNLHKGPNIAGLDPVTGTLTRLFHPRDDKWDEHFEWSAAWMRGKTDVGRTTIAVLEINEADVVAVRESLLAEGISFLIASKRNSEFPLLKTSKLDFGKSSYAVVNYQPGTAVLLGDAPRRADETCTGGLRPLDQCLALGEQFDFRS